jgi:hypothetical protein
VSNLFLWVEHHYPHNFSQIENVYEDERQKDEKLKQNAAIQGVPYEGTFDPIDSLVSIIISYLDKRKNMLQGATIGRLKHHSPNRKRADQKQAKVTPSDGAPEAKVNKGDVSGARPKDNKPKQQKPKQPPTADANFKMLEAKLQDMTAQIAKLQQPSGAHRAPQRPRNNNAAPGTDKAPVVCYLCNKPGHIAPECRTYPGERPGNNVCQNCKGRHVSDCKKRNYPQGGYNKQNNGSQRPQQNYNNNQNYQNNQGYQNNSQGKSYQKNNERFQPNQGIANGNRQHAPAESGNN